MLDRRQPSQHEQSNWLPRWHALLHGAMQTEIGRGLKGQYEIPRELPPQMLTLLTQLTEQGGQE
jgi:hypothetical protein